MIYIKKGFISYIVHFSILSFEQIEILIETIREIQMGAGTYLNLILYIKLNPPELKKLFQLYPS